MPSVTLHVVLQFYLQTRELLPRQLLHDLALQVGQLPHLHELLVDVLGVDSLKTSKCKIILQSGKYFYLELAVVTLGESEGEPADHGQQLLAGVGGVVRQGRGPGRRQGGVGLQQPGKEIQIK